MTGQRLSIVERAMNRMRADAEAKRQRILRGTHPSFLTVPQAAAILSVSHDTVLRHFGSLPGVIDVGTPETIHKRKRRELRIPQAVFDAWLLTMQVKTKKATR